MNLLLLRILFITGSMIIGYSSLVFKNAAMVGLGLGAVAALVLILMEIGLRKVSVSGLSSAVFGLILGLIMAKLVGDAFTLSPLPAETAIRS